VPPRCGGNQTKKRKDLTTMLAIYKKEMRSYFINPIGYIYIGIGYLILAIALWLMRMDLVTANAIKGFVILLATPFSLAVFMIMGNVDYTFGIIHGVGNMIGSFLASHYMANWGKNFIKIFMAVIVAICFCDLIGVISLHDFFYSILSIKE
jgi:uncharacterized membrane protein YfcA